MDPRILLIFPGFPRIALTRLAGRVARLRIPRFLRRRLWAWLGRRLSIEAKDIPGDLRDYASFLDLFTRPLADYRPEIPSDETWLSPSDGLIVEHAKISPEGSWLIKGVPYSTAELLPNAGEATHWQGIQIYLSPRDYHRYHAPCDMRVLSATALPGDLRPVDPKLMRRSYRIMATNRRVLLHCETLDGEAFALLYVGALNVGLMVFNFDETLGRDFSVKTTRAYDPPPVLKRGQEMGRFEFGSTILFFLSGDKKLLVPCQKACRVRESLFS